MIELKNEQLSIRIAELGAELQSVEDSEGREYMWQAGDEWLGASFMSKYSITIGHE